MRAAALILTSVKGCEFGGGDRGALVAELEVVGLAGRRRLNRCRELAPRTKPFTMREESHACFPALEARVTVRPGMGEMESPTLTATAPSPEVLSRALALEPPRSDEAAHPIVRAQRSGWRTTYTYGVVTAIASAIATIRDPAWWSSGLGIALGVSWLLCAAIVLARHRNVYRLAREGRLSTARFEPPPTDPAHRYALRFVDQDGHERCATWIPYRGLRHRLAPDATASVLFLPSGRTAFAWVDGHGGPAIQEAILVRDPPAEGNASTGVSAPMGSPELSTALRTPTPRSGDAFRVLVRVQRTEWMWLALSTFAVVMFCTIYAWVDRTEFVESKVFWIVAVSGLPMAGFALLGYGVARGLARHGDAPLRDSSRSAGATIPSTLVTTPRSGLAARSGTLSISSQPGRPPTCCFTRAVAGRLSGPSARRCKASLGRMRALRSPVHAFDPDRVASPSRLHGCAASRCSGACGVRSTRQPSATRYSSNRPTVDIARRSSLSSPPSSARPPPAAGARRRCAPGRARAVSSPGSYDPDRFAVRPLSRCGEAAWEGRAGGERAPPRRAPAYAPPRCSRVRAQTHRRCTRTSPPLVADVDPQLRRG